jgi:hypothetical protein
MSALVQFVVLKRDDKWVVKSKDLERVFPDQRRAVEAAIKLANDSGKDGKRGLSFFKNQKPISRTSGHMARAPIRRANWICA